MRPAHRLEPGPNQILLGDRLIDFRFVARKGWSLWRRGMTLSVGMSGVRVSAPERSRREEVERFIARHSGWLFRQLAKQEERSRSLPRRQLAQGEMFPIQGTEFPIERLPSDKARPRVEWNSGPLRIWARPESAFSQIHRALEKWLKQLAGQVFERRVQVRAGEMGLGIPAFRLRNQKSRWGSCSPGGVLHFNWRLVLAPPQILDYVVVHELAHLVHANHSQRFWNKVGKSCPDFKVSRKWLRDHGHTLVY